MLDALVEVALAAAWLMSLIENGAKLRNRASGHHEATDIAEPREIFRHLAHWTAEATGTVWVFGGALLLIAIWLATGPLFHYSDAWQLVINTGTTIVTFLMVFLIQNTQNRDARAIHLKLDELIRVSEARDLFMNLEELSDKELENLAENLALMRERSVEKLALRAEARKREVQDRVPSAMLSSNP
jgi:low affinity Fe/Cu permease